MDSIDRIIEAAEELRDNAPCLDRDELEGRLNDLENDARALTEYPVEQLGDKISELADSIHELYTDV